MINWSTSDREGEIAGVKMLVYGKAGTGKTSLCGADGAIIISAESGLLSLRHKKIPVAKVTSLTDVVEVFTWLSTPAARKNVRTVCIDSLSEICEIFLATEKRKRSDPRQAYGEMAEKMVGLIKDFRDLPGYNVLMTAKEEYDTNPVTGVTRFTARSPGKQLPIDLPYLFDEVFRSDIGRDQAGAMFYYLRTKGDPQADTKDRSGVLSEVEYPDLNYLIEKIKTAVVVPAKR